MWDDSGYEIGERNDRRGHSTRRASRNPGSADGRKPADRDARRCRTCLDPAAPVPLFYSRFANSVGGGVGGAQNRDRARPQHPPDRFSLPHAPERDPSSTRRHASRPSQFPGGGAARAGPVPRGSRPVDEPSLPAARDQAATTCETACRQVLEGQLSVLLSRCVCGILGDTRLERPQAASRLLTAPPTPLH